MKNFARRFATLVAIFGILALAACSKSPATGRTIFTGGMSPAQEIALGKQEHPKILAEFGGVYDDPELSAYISSLGGFLAKTSEMPDLAFTFTVLDSPVVNAFALPGGYVYITRGLLALAENEAEVAGVLAHEIGHVTGRHTAERYGRQTAAQIAGIGLGVLTGSGQAMNLFGTAAVLALQSYSRQQEFEADTLGVRYLGRSGYQPSAMSSFLRKLQGNSRLQAEIAGDPSKAEQFSLLQTHPRTSDRIDRAIREAGTKTVDDPIIGRGIYFDKIDGMIYGDNPAQGFVRGRDFIHPELRFRFTAPEGFRLVNTPQRVIAQNRQGAAIIFDQAKESRNLSMSDYLLGVWAKDVRLAEVESISVNGMAAATGRTRIKNRQGQFDARAVAIRYDSRTIYRFLMLTPPKLTASLSEPLRRMTYSFRRLSAKEAAKIKPLRVRTRVVRSGDTPRSLARRMPVEGDPLKHFMLINGLAPGEQLRVGQKIKVIR